MKICDNENSTEANGKMYKTRWTDVLK